MSNFHRMESQISLELCISSSISFWIASKKVSLDGLEGYNK